MEDFYIFKLREECLQKEKYFADQAHMAVLQAKNEVIAMYKDEVETLKLDRVTDRLLIQQLFAENQRLKSADIRLDIDMKQGFKQKIVDDGNVHIAKELSMNPGDTYNIPGQAGSVGPYASSSGNTFIQSGQQKTLAEAAAEIQRLLKQLEQSNPVATDAEKIAYVNNETTPSLQRRAYSALQSGGETAIEEFLDNPYVNIGKAIVKGWMKPG